MPYAYILYLEDTPAANLLTVLQRLCSPRSGSLPHITVRYPVDKLSGNDLSRYNEAAVNNLVLDSVGQFVQNTKPVRRVIYLRVLSDDLEPLAYKPDFPDSVFHITLYEGTDSEFANSLMQTLSEFPWSRKIGWATPTYLTRKEIRDRKQGHPKEQELPSAVLQILRAITESDFDLKRLVAADAKYRLGAIRKVCEELHRLFPSAADPNELPLKEIPREIESEPIQAGLFDGYEQNAATLYKFSRKRLSGHKGDHGARDLFLTPPELGEAIAKEALKYLDQDLPIAFGDPSTGNGVLFASLLRTLNGRPLESAIGVELDRGRSLETKRKWSRHGLQVVSGDFLACNDLPKRTLIIANPPYTRYQEVVPAYRTAAQKIIRDETGIDVGGQAGHFVYFLLKAHNWLKTGGVAAWLLPGDFLDSRYGKAIKQYLTQQVALRRVHFFDDKDFQFENALVTSCLIIFEKSESKTSDPVQISWKGSIEKPTDSISISSRDLVASSNWRTLNLKIEPNRTGIVIGDLFRVRRGIATGANQYFILTEEEVSKYEIPRTAIKPILPKVNSIRSDVIESDQDGLPVGIERLFVIDTAYLESDIAVRFPGFNAYLSKIRGEVMGSTLVKSRKIWYQQEQRDASPFLVSYMGRQGIRAFRNRSAAIATNSYLMLYPRMQESEIDDKILLDLFEVLRSAVSPSNIIPFARQYSGELQKLEPKALTKLPVHKVPPLLEQWLLNSGASTSFL